MSDLNDLRSTLRGKVLLPGDDGFGPASRPWNLAVHQDVSAVVEAADVADVVALVQVARDRGLTVATQPNGHGATGDVQGTILLRTGNLDDVHVDPAARTARIGAGVKGGQIQAAAAEHGLTGLPGSSAVVSVTGYTLGGGMSWFGRKYGWAADHVIAFDAVTADGEIVRVTRDENADLFWALRGGGGDYAIVTALEYRLHEVPELFGGRIVWPAAKTAQVLDAFRRITADAPDELTLWCDLLQFPGDAPAMVAIDATYLGGERDARALLRPLDEIGDPMSDTRAVIRVTDLAAITAEPTDPAPGIMRSELLTDLDSAVAVLTAEPIAPLLSVQLRHFGGAFARPTASPAGPLTAAYGVTLFGVPFTPEVGTAVRAKQEQLSRALAPWTTGRKPFNGLASGESVSDVFDAETVTRLREIKQKRDPLGVFRSNFPVNA
ncbi:FAD-binding oxidoreductase [Actinocrispum wychmicini]|uniref:FAD/FMN-containing dehydrogenase n=1 Tax=Actinocrispum wychmicini TaxID=1213861 RepID=A0A4R2JKP5_9PSEU|nr:FAD-binding oxidoreductase [Actinocrispum wychmicini]TCO54745.1 FAD/FMN-containing dehydrogenase [Actinocrispum wychmicini]